MKKKNLLFCSSQSKEQYYELQYACSSYYSAACSTACLSDTKTRLYSCSRWRNLLISEEAAIIVMCLSLVQWQRAAHKRFSWVIEMCSRSSWISHLLSKEGALDMKKCYFHFWMKNSTHITLNSLGWMEWRHLFQMPEWIEFNVHWTSIILLVLSIQVFITQDLH